MSLPLQSSLFDGESVGLGSLSAIRRTQLDETAWVDVLPGWLTGATTLFERLVERVPWHAERRPMYDRVVDVPRLVSHFGAHDPLPDRVLVDARATLSMYYAEELGDPFVTAGLAYYRDGNDSVAWHGDRGWRTSDKDTMVAILSVGAPRSLMLRPRGGGSASLRFSAGHGDLIVMGGACQRTWEHSVPKTTRPVGPRISIQFRQRGVH
ncbi:alpha-ketoglutarate-dependent dioxygenase AlkB [Nocardia camponoti]|uniref:Alkylated DNA repair protein n=1 Tax=Nocardia camponoti TaxID=1616106 RepID=A0A917QA42_9NOCA|nr:alpha-ketoglutarate-dependent dioxygenase AlkB [Nocardia camponoti]GGK39463.1 alkylated DNA repair protein [Nocardia camponoti]